MKDRELKLVFTVPTPGSKTPAKKTITFGYIKENLKDQEAIDLANAILDSGCYELESFVGATVVETTFTPVIIY